MRQIQVTVRRDDEAAVLRLADEHGAFSPAAATVRTRGGERTMVFASVPNDRVGGFVGAVEEAVEHAEIGILPRGVLPLHTPVEEVHTRVRSVSPLSPLELVLAGLQSIGSWRGMLLYAGFSGAVASYGILFNVPWLLTAAMLIAPFGAPAMVCVIATAVGDWTLFRRGVLRFWIAAAVLAAAALAVGAAYGVQVSTALMEQISSLSLWTVLTGLVGGAAGAQSQVQSDRDSLVTSTATGFLVAVSLSPPTAVLGLSLALGRWDYALEMAFVVLLTFCAIVAAGWASLRLYGVVPGRQTAGRGSARTRTLLAAGAALATAALVGWQAGEGPRLRKADLSSEAIVLARDAADAVSGVRVLEAEARFTRRDLALPGGGEALLVRVVAEGREGGGSDAAAQVRAAVERRIRASMDGVRPYVDVTLIPAPALR